MTCHVFVVAYIINRQNKWLLAFWKINRLMLHNLCAICLCLIWCHIIDAYKHISSCIHFFKNTAKLIHCSHYIVVILYLVHTILLADCDVIIKGSACINNKRMEENMRNCAVICVDNSLALSLLIICNGCCISCVALISWYWLDLCDCTIIIIHRC